MKFHYDEPLNRFVFYANDFNTSGRITEAFSPYFQEVAEKPGVPILIYRDKPTTAPFDWNHLKTLGTRNPDGALEIFSDRKIALVLDSNQYFATARQISAMVDYVGINFRPFKTEQEAIDWLED